MCIAIVAMNPEQGIPQATASCILKYRRSKRLMLDSSGGVRKGRLSIMQHEILGIILQDYSESFGW